MATTCQISTAPVASSTASSPTSTPVTAEVTISSTRRSMRSASTPPKRLTAIVGAAVAAPTYPRSRGEPPSPSTTSQPVARMMNCVPATAPSEPNQ